MQQQTTKPVEQLTSVVIRFSGDSGDGMQLTGSQFTTASAQAGNDLATLPDYPAEIRAPIGTVAGVSGFQIHFGATDIFSPGDDLDVLVTMNPAGLKANLKWLKKGGILLVNTDGFNKKGLATAGYEHNPIEDGSLSNYRVFAIDIGRMTSDALHELNLPAKTVLKCRNFFALGLVFWLFDRPTDVIDRELQKKFSKKPELLEANKRVFRAGYLYGENNEIFPLRYQVPSANLPAGTYRNITGNSAVAIGMATAAHMAGVQLYLGSYPITPASEIMQDLAALKRWGVKTVQCEDEIAGICSAIGASFGGALALTNTSGPGISLKLEAMGLALILEIPLVIVNVQRGGPSTGLPTKTEQSDLMQALFGRHGDSPLPVLAARSPADGFECAMEAARIAIKYMTPVMLLTDGYTAQGSEPWLLPDPDKLPTIERKFQTNPEGWQPYKRNPDTLARDWVVPGTAGMQHRIGGLEKDSLTGGVSHDQDNHERMTKLRAAKVAGIVRELPKTEVDGPQSGETLVVTWGSTYGSATMAVRQLRTEGVDVSHVHLRWLNPLPSDLGDILKRFKRILVPEVNNGQLVKLLRMEYLVDAKGINKIKGAPFWTSEVRAGILSYLHA